MKIPILFTTLDTISTVFYTFRNEVFFFSGRGKRESDVDDKILLLYKCKDSRVSVPYGNDKFVSSCLQKKKKKT